MKHFQHVLLSPFTLSLCVTTLAFLVFPLKIRKYEATLAESGNHPGQQRIIYDDLDFDGNSERIACFHNSLDEASITISNCYGILDQWSFRGMFNFSKSFGYIITGDQNNDKIKELYVFTLLDDSIYLHVITNFKQEGALLRNRFVTKVGKRDDKVDPYIIGNELNDLNHDGSKELIFVVGTGYSLYPRRVYAWSISRDTFMVSPATGYFFKGIIQKDVTGDTIKEIIPYGYASSNVHDTTLPFHDQSSRLMVLDQKLQFVFNPLAFPGAYSSLTPEVITDENNKPVITALYRPPDGMSDSGTLMICNIQGQLLKKVFVPRSAMHLLSLKDKDGKERLLLCRYREGWDIYNASLDFIRTVPFSIGETTVQEDIDLDGLNEIINFDLTGRQVVIFRNDLKHPVVLSVSGHDVSGLMYSLRLNAGCAPKLYLQWGSNYFLYEYFRNPAYPYRFLFYVAIYLSTLLFIGLIRKIQREQLKKKQETEKKITELQLQIVRNQLDPHFIMNAINSIIVSITDREKEEARQQLLHFSKMHRSLLLSADQVQRSLVEEISFTESYLALEKFRFRDRFDYRIDAGPAVNPSVQVPKMILQVHAENALKHGILPLDGKGLLTIGITADGNDLAVEITDNGVGREYARSHKKESTGKGLTVMEQYAALINKYNPGKIKTTIEDLYDASGKPCGTKVKIIMSGAV